jgi:type IX secretion system PorP/SprF family membrane protein
MKTLNKIFATISLTIVSAVAVAQNINSINPPASQFFSNKYISNPAQAGAGLLTGLKSTVSYVGQMEAIPGSPSTRLLTLDYKSTGNVGLGLLISKESAGLFNNTRVMGSYAYKVDFNAEGTTNLRLGLSFGFTRQMIDMGQINALPGDASVVFFNNREALLDADMGFVYTDRNFTLEGSAQNLRRGMEKSYTTEADFNLFYTAMSYNIKVNNEINVTPKFAFRGVKNYDNIADIGAEISFKEPLKLMAMYHTTKSTSMGFQYNRNNRWQFYGFYTTPTRALVGLNAGGFEMGVQLRTGK